MIALLVQASQGWIPVLAAELGHGSVLLDSTRTLRRASFAALNCRTLGSAHDNQSLLSGFRSRGRRRHVFSPARTGAGEFERSALPDKTSWYTLLRRDESGALVTVPLPWPSAPTWEKARPAPPRRASTSDSAFGAYLRMRPMHCCRTISASDLAWMDMKSNPVDIVIVPIETTRTELFGYKASYEAWC